MNNVFYNQPKITADDVQRLQSLSSNWVKLNKWICSRPPLEELKKAALIESLGKKRVSILDRLLQRIYAIEKQNTFVTLINTQV